MNTFFKYWLERECVSITAIHRRKQIRKEALEALMWGDDILTDAERKTIAGLMAVEPCDVAQTLEAIRCIYGRSF